MSFVADAVLALHVAVVLFVVGGLVLVIAGNRAGWHWVNHWWLRLAHLAAIAYVAAQAWWGLECPLTTLEMSEISASAASKHSYRVIDASGPTYR